eukprot:1180405-Prorocentrum_minimum.AAC.1
MAGGDPWCGGVTKRNPAVTIWLGRSISTRRPCRRGDGRRSCCSGALQEGRRAGIPVGPSALNAVLRTCGRAADWDRARHWLEQGELAPPRWPDAAAYGQLIAAAGQAGEVIH